MLRRKKPITAKNPEKSIDRPEKYDILLKAASSGFIKCVQRHRPRKRDSKKEREVLPKCMQF